MTPTRLIAIFKALTEYKTGVFFCGITAEFLRDTVEKEDSQGKTFVVIDMQGMSVKDDFTKRGYPQDISFTIHIIKRDVADSVSQPADNKAEYPDSQTICLDCYDFWMDLLSKLRADVSSNADYVSTYFQEMIVNLSDATFYIKPKLLGLMSGIFVRVTSKGMGSC